MSEKYEYPISNIEKKYKTYGIDIERYNCVEINHPLRAIYDDMHQAMADGEKDFADSLEQYALEFYGPKIINRVFPIFDSLRKGNTPREYHHKANHGVAVLRGRRPQVNSDKDKRSARNVDWHKLAVLMYKKMPNDTQLSGLIGCAYRCFNHVRTTPGSEPYSKVKMALLPAARRLLSDDDLHSCGVRKDRGVSS